ncbi:MAG TPA: hypothetical protein VG733_16115, partial [Chthoniobacteraceae bacterium]|nr:hypothetical protein [Chthoniobacteraceae bacterium]
HRLDAQLFAGADDPQCDFPTVGDQNALKHVNLGGRGLFCRYQVCPAAADGRLRKWEPSMPVYQGTVSVIPV